MSSYKLRLGVQQISEVKVLAKAQRTQRIQKDLFCVGCSLAGLASLRETDFCRTPGSRRYRNPQDFFCAGDHLEAIINAVIDYPGDFPL